MNLIGIMQGRLSPPTPGRLQAFPWETWELEFERARAIGFDGLEWLFEVNNLENNPIWNRHGRERIRRLAGQHGVRVQSVCAHYFAQRGFGNDEESRLHSVSVLTTLIRACALLEIPGLVIPFLEAASLRSESRRQEALDFLKMCLTAAAENGVRLALETDLAGPECAELIQRLDQQWVGVCYDTGNATALGYDIVADVQVLLPWLVEVHIKDRLRNGGSVLLGRGDTPFAPFFQVLAEAGYQGPFILETPTGDDWEGNARRHLQFVRALLESARGMAR